MLEPEKLRFYDGAEDGFERSRSRPACRPFSSYLGGLDALLARQAASLEAQTYRTRFLLAADVPLDQARVLCATLDSLPVSCSKPSAPASTRKVARAWGSALPEYATRRSVCVSATRTILASRKGRATGRHFRRSDTSLCHSDARIVARDGELIAPSMFAREARIPDARLADLLVMNSVTGMTAIFRRDVALAAAELPLAGCRYVLHDQWVALVASLFGRHPFHRGSARRLHAASGQCSQRHLMEPRRPPQCFVVADPRLSAEILLASSFGGGAFLKLFGAEFAHVTLARIQLSAEEPRSIFDCQSPFWSALAASLALRLRGRHRQADQLWRLVLGKILFCRRRSASLENPPAAPPGSATASASGGS